MLASLRKYLRVYQLGLQEQMEYRFNHVVESLIGVATFVILFFLWRAIYAAHGDAPIRGFTLPQMLTYLLISKFWSWVIDPHGEVDEALSRDIREGGLSRFLVRPVSDPLYRLSLYFSHKTLYGATRLGPMLLAILAFPWFFELPRAAVQLWVFPVMVLAMLLQFTISYAFTLAAFWMLSVWGLLFLKRNLIAFLAGAWFPLTLFPDEWRDLILALPFHYLVYFPVRIAQGALSSAEILRGCGLMALWTLLFAAVAALLWRAGLRQYTASGI